MTGMMNGCARLGANIRHSFGGPISSISSVRLAFDIPVHRTRLGNDYMGMGILISSDRMAFVNDQNITALGSFAYHKSLDEDARYTFSLGLQAGVAHKSSSLMYFLVRNDILGFGTGNSSIPIPSGNTTYLELNGGAIISFAPSNYVQFYLGTSFYHLTNPKNNWVNENSNFLKLRPVLHVGISVRASEALSFSASALASGTVPDDAKILSGKMAYHFKTNRSLNNAIHWGISYQIAEFFIPFVGAQFDRYKFGFSYGIGIVPFDSLASFPDNNLEVSFVYEAFCGHTGSPERKRVFYPKF